jgi:hypothetical protein
MTRFVSLLLIPMFMLGQAWPHSHAGFTGVDSDEHALRPHVHFSTADRHEDDHHHLSDGSHDHASHSHQHSDGPAHENHSPHEHRSGHEVAASHCTIDPLFDHEADAVYIAAVTSVAPRTVVSTEVDQSAVLCWIDPAFTPSARWRNPTDDPPDRYVSLPIYLLTASLRL